MAWQFPRRLLPAAVLAFAPWCVLSPATAAAPSPEQALKLVPTQKEVDFDTPSAAEIARCQIKAEKIAGNTGWVVRDPQGSLLRKFVDTNGDNIVDRWSYYRDGIEIYRDIDENFNGKVDQCRWLNAGGSRWGLDTNEDGTIDSWKMISAEEVSAEVVAALRDRDMARFRRVLLSEQELDKLKLDAPKTQELGQRIEEAPSDFEAISGKQKMLKPRSRWVDFGGTLPSLIPGDTDGEPGADLLLYDNVVAMVDNEGSTGQVHLGTIVQVGDGWRVLDAPQIEPSGRVSLALRPELPDSSGDVGPGASAQKLLTELEQLDQQAIAATSLEDQATVNTRRADLLEELVEQAASEADREAWVRQLADTISAAAQSGGYPDGVDRLQSLIEKLSADPKDEELKTYVEFRHLMADYVLKLQKPDGDAAKTQEEWLKGLEKFVTDHPQSPDAPEAMLQLATTHEFAGGEAEALKWYGEIVSNFPQTPAAKKAAGARTRLESVGKSIRLQGRSLTGQTIDLNSAPYRGKVVLIHYWASWSDPCRAELPQLKELQAKYGRRGLAIIGVSLDSNRKALEDFLAQNRLPWQQIYEDGGLENRLATEMGIPILPTMILLDQKGKVVNRSIHVSELDGELSKLLK